ncbi:MAG: sigma-54-dependent Fis family transcriptional regulator [Gammaproteobacteria bacterium]|nr:sigma-54-dependent Fis family transcriptional regulator [Gammaproteobacteria bacterium]
MTKKRALIVDDEPDIRELLEITLGRMNIETAAAADLSEALDLLKNQSFDLCLTDMQLPDGDGLQLVAHINQYCPELPVAMITAFGSMDTAIFALKAGAFDFLQKPVDLDQLRSLVETALKVNQANEIVDVTAKLLGTSQTMDNLRGKIAKLARSQAPIYIAGESGSGKEVAARLIHSLGPRAGGEFIAVNCGAIPSELMESEFFGHVKGSFTGAVADKLGLFQAAAGGTLFLDEVADLPLSMQVKLLRAIQEKAVRPVGSQSEDTTDIRVLCATHKDLAEEVNAGRFRQDLYYRINVIELHIPALREHLEDINELAAACLNRLANEYAQAVPSISSDALTTLQQYDFPGNVRELENILERAFTLCEDNNIKAEDLQLQMHFDEPTAVAPPVTPPVTDKLQDTPRAQTHSWNLPPGQSLEDFLEGIERELITQALDKTRWNKTAAAKELGITFRALRYKLKKLDME